VRCLSCGLVRQLTRPVSASALYGGDYYVTDHPKGGYAITFSTRGINHKTFRRRLRAIESRYGRCGRLLDVGCALGDFVLEAGRSGWDSEGVEISTFAAEQARKRGASVMTGDLADLALPAARYDVVTLYDVIEHLFDPNAVLREIARLLKPGGLLHIVTPNVGGIQARVLGCYWYHYKPGEHLYYFDPGTLRRVLETNCLEWDGWGRSGSHVTFSYLFIACGSMRHSRSALSTGSAALCGSARTHSSYTSARWRRGGASPELPNETSRRRTRIRPGPRDDVATRAHRREVVVIRTGNR
jgi:SAM-dependent methyltransferase